LSYFCFGVGYAFGVGFGFVLGRCLVLAIGIGIGRVLSRFPPFCPHHNISELTACKSSHPIKSEQRDPVESP
jgi:hypothetical protein